MYMIEWSSSKTTDCTEAKAPANTIAMKLLCAAQEMEMKLLCRLKEISIEGNVEDSEDEGILDEDKPREPVTSDEVMHWRFN